MGLCIENDIYPTMYAQEYKQYHFSFADKDSALYNIKTDITFIIFDSTPLLESEFTNSSEHITTILKGIEELTQKTAGHLVISTLPRLPVSVYANMYEHDPMQQHIESFNSGIRAIATEHSNVTIFDINRLFQLWGDIAARDVRSLYAYDIPYTNDFSLALCHELVSFLLALRGKAKKCIVTDLDNTLWGGVVGEVGTHGINLGHGYPGVAFQQVQRTLKEYSARGIILAIASRNNISDTNDVFENNSHMILKKSDFANIQINWNVKSENIKTIARELNIGLDSIVFVDDDPANRAEVRSALPQVLVVPLSAAPEEYARTLLSLTCFNQLTLTQEDRQKNTLYEEESRRKKVLETNDPIEYLEKLGISVHISKNDVTQIPRLAQLSQKTNQFNLTTHRYSEHDLETMIKEGALVYGADARDTFGHYGVVALTILKPLSKVEIELDTFLMSCRAMGRGIEFAFLDTLFETIQTLGYTTVVGKFIQTAKNEPVRMILPDMGFESSDTQTFSLTLTDYFAHKPKKITSILPHLSITIQK